jgi:signal transduction histidine kinase
VSANALLTIINDILDFSKLEAGKYSIQSVRFQPKVVIQEVAELLASRAHDKQIELIYRIDPSIPSVTIGDPDRFRQILNNLVGNAIKFTDNGEVFINATVASQGPDDALLRIAVHDSGIGIDNADLPKLCEVFCRSTRRWCGAMGGRGSASRSASAS